MAAVDHDGVRLHWESEAPRPADETVARRLPPLLDVLETGVVVGHNLQFDVRFLTYEAKRLKLRGLDLQFADTLGLARELRPHRDDHQLESLLDAVGASPDEELHTAVGDALATRALFWHLVEAEGLTTLSDVGVKRLCWNAG